MAFDPDAYLAKSAFDPDAYLSQGSAKEKPSFTSMLKDEIVASVPGGIVRGVKDIIDTGAGFISRLASPEEAARVQAMNEAGKKEFQSAQERTGNTVGPAIGRIAGNIAATAPVTALGGAAASAAGLSRLGSAIASGGMSTGAKVAPGIANRLADLGIRSAGGAIGGGAAAGLVDPESAGTGALIGAAFPAILPVAKAVGTGVRKTLASTTGVGDDALKQALQAGQSGGVQAQQFTSAMRGKSSIDDALVMAKENLMQMGAQKQQAYRSGMAGIKSDKSILSFNGIDDAIKDATNISMFKGQAKNQRAAQLVQQASDEVSAWKALDPTEYHTPEGLDALKQRIGGILESIPFEEKTARSAISNIYNSVKGEINKQAPGYAKVMKDYSDATELIREIEKSLSLGQRASADTSIRKLQSLMRNNVNTSYGYRDELAKQMVGQGGNDIFPMLAGQSLNEWTPRGIQRAAAGTGTGLLAITGNVPAAAGMAAISSPRLVGEAMYGVGRMSGQNKLADLLMQGGARVAPIAAAQ